MKKLIILASLFTISSTFAFNLKYLDYYEIKTGTKYKDTNFGGISGIVQDQEVLYGIADDRGELGKPRMYTLKPTYKNGDLKVDITGVTNIKSDKNGDFAMGKIDFEGITLLPNGNLLISSEGDNRFIPHILPRVAEYKKDGTFVRYWTVDEKYEKRTRFNAGFEGLTATKTSVFYMNENTLEDDGTIAGPETDGLLRLTKQNLDQSYTQYVYELNRIPNKAGGKIKGDIGVSGMLAIDDNNLLMIERSWIDTIKQNEVNIVHAQINDATDVSNMQQLPKTDLKYVTKKLVADLRAELAKVKDNTGFDYLKLDNIEGIAWGPKLENGNSSVILVSDNNFSKHQRTLFLLFELKY